MTRRSKSVVQALMVSLTYGCSRSSAQANFERQASELLLQRFETVVSATRTCLHGWISIIRSRISAESI